MPKTIVYYLLDQSHVWHGNIVTLTTDDPVPYNSTSSVPPDNPGNKILRYTGYWEFIDVLDVPEPPVSNIRPKIVITGIKENGVSLIQTDFSEATTTIGKRLDFTAELRHPDLGFVLPVDDMFRMPIRSRDGREEVIKAVCVQGVITFSIDFTESRVWGVTEDVINADLPLDSLMGFDGITVFVLKD